MIELWPFQASAVDEIRAAYRSGFRAPLLVAPTGSGKTVLFSYITHSHIERTEAPHVLILVNRSELVEQVEATAKQFGITPAIADGEHRYRPGRAVTVGSVFTVARRLSDFPRPTLVIVDEAHHAAEGSTWARCLHHFAHSPRLGVTATPTRLDGGGLGNAFDTIIAGPQTADLIRDGFLSPVRIFAPPLINTNEIHKRYGEFAKGELQQAVDKSSITGDAIEHYERHAPGRRAIVFCVSVDHAERMAEAFNAKGHPAFSVDGSLTQWVRRDRINAFRDGRVRILTSCDLVSEGFDVPQIECGISLRPTMSLGLWLQQVGRCLRRSPGKKDAIILDHAGNTLRHGLPTDRREWSLDTTCATKKQTISIKLCEQCFAANPRTAPRCIDCGAEFVSEKNSRYVKQKAGDLHEVTEFPDTVPSQVRRLDQRQLDSLESLIAEGQKRGYKNPAWWANNVIKGRARKGRSA
jgi:superfamily II DNA or RNA helicase